MTSANEDSIDCLMQNVESVDQMLQLAEQKLREIGHYDEVGPVEDESSSEHAMLCEALEKFDAINMQIDAYKNRFAAWAELEVTIYQKSEVTRSLGQIKRLTLVTQNILRICKRSLGMPDPEREQQELQMQLAMMGQQFI